jgi:hypothetical protein
MWNLPPQIRTEIGRELEDKFSFLFEKLNVLNTRPVLDKFIHPPDVPLKVPAALSGEAGSQKSGALPKTERYDEGE